MPQFTYAGTGPDGKNATGTLDAIDELAARSALRGMHISVDDLQETHPSPAVTAENDYYPLVDTLRLYAGWLLACLFPVYALGSYQQLRHLPVHSFLLDEWYTSPLILEVTYVTFVFLLLSGVYRALGRGLWKGIFLTICGIALLLAFVANA